MTNNSPQLRNMTFNETFESSLVERNHEKFTIDKSLINGIKENDVSKIIDRNETSGNQDAEQLYNQYGELQALLVSTRKKYDGVKTQGFRIQKQIEKLRLKKERLEQDENKYNQIIEKQRNDLTSTKTSLNSVSDLMEASVYRKDIYLHIKDVLKKDLLVLKKRYFDKDVLLMRDKTKLNTIRTEHSNKIKLSKRCREMLDNVEKTVQEKQMERNHKINSFCEIVARKQMNQRNREIREKQIEETMISAMTDKLAEEKQWINILHSNLFLKNMLKAKMERLMEEHRTEEIAFHQIKQQTSVKNTDQFIEKFLGREETYGLLLQSISDKEAKLEQIKVERQELEKKYNQVLYKSEEIAELMKAIEPTQTVGLQKRLGEVNEHLLNIQKQKQMIYQWGIKFISSYQGHRNRRDIQQKFPKNHEKQLVSEALKLMKEFMKNVTTQQDAEKKIQKVYMKTGLPTKTLSTEMSEKNMRIKTLSAYEPGFNAEIEDKDVAYDDLSEMDYLQHNRRAIKKNEIQNRKFRIKTKPY